MLEHPKDIQRMVAAMRFVQRLMDTEPLSQFCGGRFPPVRTKTGEKFARSSYTSYYHGVGTCKIGPLLPIPDRSSIKNSPYME